MCAARWLRNYAFSFVGAVPDPLGKLRSVLRARYRARRLALSGEQQQRAAQQAARRARPLLKRYRRIAFYSARDGELDPHPLLCWALARGQCCYLPQVRRRTLAMVRYRRGEALQPGCLGVSEPAGEARRAWSVRRLDLVLLPLVACDAAGNRLGTGAGFYDRCLAACRRSARRPLLLGAAHSCQLRRALPVRPWDVPVDGVLTERGLIRLRPRHSPRRRHPVRGGRGGNTPGAPALTAAHRPLPAPPSPLPAPVRARGRGKIGERGVPLGQIR